MGVDAECVDAPTAQTFQRQIPVWSDRTGDLVQGDLCTRRLPSNWVAVLDSERRPRSLRHPHSERSRDWTVTAPPVAVLDQPDRYPVRSHDFWTLQWERILSALSGSNTSIREQNLNIWMWLFDPLPFFTKAYGVASIPWHGWGKIIVYLGALLAGWHLRSNTTMASTHLVPIISGTLLTWIAKDLHHLAMATPLLGLWLVYTFDQVSWKAPPLLVMGGLWFGTQIWTLTDAPKIINAVKTPTFSEMRQQALEDLITQNDYIQRLITMDYEVYGVLEARMPWLPMTHMWYLNQHRALGCIAKDSSREHRSTPCRPQF